MKTFFSHFRHCPVCGSEHFLPHNEKSKRCATCGFEFYHNPSSATVAIIENQANELLVVRRGKDPAKGTLDLPGGFCDIFETAEEGLIREVKEETGLTLTHYEYLFSVPNIYPYSGLNIHTIDLFFRCVAKEGQEVRAMDDASEAFWIPWNQVNEADFGLPSIRKGIHLLKNDKKCYK